MLMPLGISIYYGENDTTAFLITIGIAAVIGSILFFQYPNTERKTLGKRDGIMVVSLCWICFSLLGSLPFILSGAVENMAEAFFETVSGVTGTGTPGEKRDTPQGRNGTGQRIWRCYRVFPKQRF